MKLSCEYIKFGFGGTFQGKSTSMTAYESSFEHYNFCLFLTTAVALGPQAVMVICVWEKYMSLKKENNNIYKIDYSCGMNGFVR